MIKAGFILITLVMAAVIYSGLSYASLKAYGNGANEKRFRLKVGAVLVVWLMYVAGISNTGILTAVTFPPRIPLLLVLPAFGIMAYFLVSGKFKAVRDAVPAGGLVYVQSFRILVELLLWRSYVVGLVPKSATFEGYNYEIIIGITALIVGYFGYTKKALPAAAIAIWNVAGLITLAIIVFIFISHAYAPSLWADMGGFSMKTFGSFPYTLLAGFLMPLAVFMHIFSLKKLKNTAARHEA